MTITIVLLALVAAFFYGLALVLTQAGLRHLPPLQGSCVAIPTATAVFVALSPVTVDWGGWDTGSAGIFVLIGCLFPATVTILTFQANRVIGPNLTGALGNLAPLFAVFFAVIALGEAPGAGKIAGVAIIVAGVVLLYRAPSVSGVGRDEGRGGGLAWAFALPVAAAFIRGAVQPAVKVGLADWPNPFAAVTIGYLVSTLIVYGVSAIKERGWPVVWRRNGWLWFSAVGLSNGVAVLITYQALALGEVTVVAPLVACYPLATLGLGWAFLGKADITRRTVIGVGITVAGVAVLLGA